MAIPATAIKWGEVMDPYDVLDYYADLTGLLGPGEAIASYTVSLPAESELAGLNLGQGAYDDTLNGGVIGVWLSIDALQSAAFTVLTPLPVEFSITTTSNPPRKRQRTFVVQVAQR